MNASNKDWKQQFKPGTTGGIILYTCLFFFGGLLLVTIGFWKTLFVLLLSLVGLFIGASANLRGDVSAMINRVVPEKGEKVVYTQEELDMLKNLRREKEQAAEQPAEDKEQA